MPNHLRSVMHTGITVENMDNAIALWRDVFGFELTESGEVEGEFAATVTRLPGIHTRMAMMSGGGHTIELSEYLAPDDDSAYRPRPSTRGFIHVALEVDDIDKTVDECRALGVIPYSPVQTLEGEPIPGLRLVYMLTPEGITIELMEKPAQP